VAEYFRHWFANPQVAEQRAPHFTAALREVMHANPTFARQLTEVQGLVQRYLRQPAEVRGAARVSVAPSGIVGRVRDVLAELKANRERGSVARRMAYAWRDTGNLPSAAADPGRFVQSLLTQTIDRHQATWQALREAAPDLPPSMNAYVLMRLADKAPAMAEGMLRVGPRGRSGQRLGPGLWEVLKPVAEDIHPDPAHPERPDLLRYLVARRALELLDDPKGARDPGLTREEAQALIANVEQSPKAQAFETAAQGVYDYLGGLRRYAVQHGALSADQARALADATFYVPLQRVIGERRGVEPGSAKYANRQSPIKRLKGSGLNIIDPIESVVKNTFALVGFVERNRAATALVDALGDRGEYLQRIPTPQEATRFNLREVQGPIVRALIEGGLIDEAQSLADDPSVLNGMVTVYTPTAFERDGERILFIQRNGQREFYQVQDEALYRDLAGMGPQAISPLMKMASGAANVLRAGVTSRPSFVVRNLLRDTLGALFQSREGFIPVYDSIRGLASLLREDKDYRQYLSFGIGQATLLGNDRGQLRAAIREATTLPRGRLGRLAQPIVHPLDFLQRFSEAVETATRLGEFKLTKEAGGRPRRAGVLGIVQRLADRKRGRYRVNRNVLTQAALNAADVTVDFSRGGSLIKQASTIDTFLNARVQGLVRGVETAANDPVGVAVTAASLAGLSALLWTWNHEDRAYQELDDETRANYWHIRLPGTEHWLVVPKPFVWSFFANATEKALDQTARDRPAALHPLRDWVQENGRSLVTSLVPTIVLPTLEAFSNWDYYRNRAIVPDWLQALEPDLQVSDWTSDTFRVLGRATGLSPAQLEHFARQTAGGAVGDLATLTDPLAAAVLNRRRPPQATRDVTEVVPGLSGFLAPHAIGSRAASIETFYRRWADIEEARGSLKAYRQGQGQADADRYLQRHHATLDPAFVARMTAAHKQIDALHDQLDAIEGGTLPPDQKRIERDRIRAALAEAARRGLEGR
jgi:hypothetical protein